MSSFAHVCEFRASEFCILSSRSQMVFKKRKITSFLVWKIPGKSSNLPCLKSGTTLYQFTASSDHAEKWSLLWELPGFGEEGQSRGGRRVPFSGSRQEAEPPLALEQLKLHGTRCSRCCCAHAETLRMHGLCMCQCKHAGMVGKVTSPEGAGLKPLSTNDRWELMDLNSSFLGHLWWSSG